MSTWSISEECAREHARKLRDLASGLLLGAMEVRSDISSLSADSLEEASHEAEALALAFEAAVQPGDVLPQVLARAQITIELLAALEALDHATDDDNHVEIDGPDFDMAKQQARAAISKARGDAS